MVPQPLNVQADLIYSKLIEIGKTLGVSFVKDNSHELNDGNTERTLSLSDISAIHLTVTPDNKIIKVTAQFAFSNSQEYILQALSVLSVSVLATPSPDKTFKVATSMIDKIGKQVSKAKGSIKEVQEVDGHKVEMNVHKNLGGLSFFSIEKLEKQPVIFE